MIDGYTFVPHGEGVTTTTEIRHHARVASLRASCPAPLRRAAAGHIDALLRFFRCPDGGDGDEAEAAADALAELFGVPAPARPDSYDPGEPDVTGW